MRALAVICITLFHLQIPGFSGGYVGVDLFFVISGFLITQIVQREYSEHSFSFANFAERRIRRIFPSLLVMLAITCLAAAALFSVTDLLVLADTMPASLLMAANVYFYHHNGYFDAYANTKPLLHLWSLGVEAQFYLLWPVLLLFILRHVPPAQRWIAVGVLALASLATSIVLSGPNATGAFYLIPSRMFEFLIGAGLTMIPASVSLATQKKPIPDMLFLAGLAMVALSIALYTKQTPFPSYYALLPCIGAALTLHAGNTALLRPLLSNPLMAYIGRISYELYLFHWAVLIFYQYTLFEPLQNSDKAIILGITVALSIATYHAIGLPLRRACTGSVAQRHNYLIGCLILCLALLGTALSMKISGGWIWRLAPEARLFVQDPGEFHKTQFGGVGYKEGTIITLGDASAPPQFLIVGDSFASQYASAMSEFLAAHHKSAYLYFLNGCLIMPHVTAHIPGEVNVDCDVAYEKVQQILHENRLPVIQAQSWSSYKKQLARRNDNSMLSFNPENNDDYYAFIIDATEQMRVALDGRSYAFVGIAPGITEQQSLVRCFQVPTYFPTQCAATVAIAEEKRQNGQEFNRAAATYAKTHPEVHFLNPRQALCRDGLCYAIDNKSIFYSDYIHLTKDGARQVIDHYQDLVLSLHP